jgi:hypothetical protein
MYCDVIRDHHSDEWDPVNKMLAIVRFVNMACSRIGLGLKHEPDLVLIGTKEAEILDITDTQIVELEAMLEEAREVVL